MQERGVRGFAQAEVQFANAGMDLAGTVVQPATVAPRPAAILVHGSGPADRDSNGYFVAMREHLATNGLAVLCYDKPGVGGSTGDWRRQSFADRAREVVAALRFLQQYPGIDARQIGLVGGSQAGWVMPVAARLAPEMSFIVSVSGAAVRPHEQEAYRVERQLRVDGFPEEQVHRALALFARRLQMIRQGAPVEQVFALQAAARGEPWYSYLDDDTPEDLAFFAAICDFDPVPYLEQISCPFLGIWGELDTYVPVEKSIAITRAALAKAGNARHELRLFPRANHGIRLAVTGSPRERATTFAPGYLELITAWLATVLTY